MNIHLCQDLVSFCVCVSEHSNYFIVLLFLSITSLTHTSAKQLLQINDKLVDQHYLQDLS